MNPCQPIEQEIAFLQQERDELSQQIANATDPREKANLRQRWKMTGAMIAAKRRDLTICVRQQNPDLIPTGFVFHRERDDTWPVPNPGAIDFTCTITLDIFNAGRKPMRGAFNVLISSNQDVFQPWDNFVSINLPESTVIPPGVTVSIVCLTGFSFRIGTPHRFTAFIDQFNQVDETNETNNLLEIVKQFDALPPFDSPILNN